MKAPGYTLRQISTAPARGARYIDAWAGQRVATLLYDLCFLLERAGYVEDREIARFTKRATAELKKQGWPTP